MSHIKIIIFQIIFLLNASLVSGAVFDGGDIVNISRPVNDDLYVTGDEINIQSKVTGDVIGYGRKFYMNDTITGDVTLFCDQLIVNGMVLDDIRFAGRSIKISNDIKGDLIIFGGEVNIDKDVIIYGDLIVNGGTVNVEGTVKGNIRIRCETAKITGVCEGNMDVQATNSFTMYGYIKGKSKMASHSLVLHTDKSRFNDDVEYWTKDNDLNFSGMMIKGQAKYNNELEIEKWDWKFFGLHPAGFFLGFLLMGYACVLFFLYLFSKTFLGSASIIQNSPVKSLGWGVLYFLGMPAVIVVLMVLIIGIPLAILLFFIYLFSILFGMVISSIILAYMLILKRNYICGFWKISIVAFLFLILVNLIMLIPLLGFLFLVLLVTACYGAILKMLIENQKLNKAHIN